MIKRICVTVLLCVGAVSIAAPTPVAQKDAPIQSITGPYFGIGAGYTYLGDIKEQQIDDHSGPELSAVVGYQITPRYGAEYRLESLPQTRYHNGNTMRDNLMHVFTATAQWMFTKNYAITAQLGSAYLVTWAKGRFVPYLGVGASYQLDSANRVRLLFNTTTASAPAPSTFSGALSFTHIITW